MTERRPYSPRMEVLTGQEILVLAMRKAGGAAALVGKAKLRRHSPAEGLDHQVRGWASGKTKKGPPADIVVLALDYLEAIDWQKLEAVADEIRATEASSIAATRDAIDHDLHGQSPADEGSP
jgi:hypothetical protein